MVEENNSRRNESSVIRSYVDLFWLCSVVSYSEIGSQRRYRILLCNWPHSGEDKFLEKTVWREWRRHEKAKQVQLIIRRSKDAMYLLILIRGKIFAMTYVSILNTFQRQTRTSAECLGMLDVKYMSRERLRLPSTVTGNYVNSLLFTFVRKQWCVKNSWRANTRRQIVISQRRFMDHQVTKIVPSAWLYYPSIRAALKKFHI